MPDTIETECLECRGRFAVPASTAGKKIRCPKCQGIISVAGKKPSGPATQQPRTQLAANQTAAAKRTRPETRPARKPSSEPLRPKADSNRAPSRAPQPRRQAPPKPRPSRNARSQSRAASPSYEDDELYDAPNASRYAEPQPRMPSRRKKKKQQPTQPQLPTHNDDDMSWSYEGQRLLSIGFSLLMIIGGFVWIHLELTYSTRIHFYPFFLIGGGLLNIARACLAD